MAENEENTTITGQYVFAPNPCTTRPCLPGMTYAIESGGQFFIITLGGCWSDQAHDWNGWTPSVGDVVCVTGTIRRQTDISGNPFFTIEVESLTPAVQ